MLCSHYGANVSPVCTVFGGLAAQEVLRAVSETNEPACNHLVFDARLGGAQTQRVGGTE